MIWSVIAIGCFSSIILMSIWFAIKANNIWKERWLGWTAYAIFMLIMNIIMMCGKLAQG